MNITKLDQALRDKGYELADQLRFNIGQQTALYYYVNYSKSNTVYVREFSNGQVELAQTIQMNTPEVALLEVK